MVNIGYGQYGLQTKGGEAMDRRRHVLICGGAGYIGSHMVRALVEKGWEPVVFDNLSTGHHESVQHKGVTLIRGDLMDKQSLRRVFAEYSFDAVAHFAGLIAVGESVLSPLTYYQNNVAGTLNLVEVMVESHVLRLVFSSTAAVYGNPGTGPIPETHPCLPLNPYGHSKLMVETILEDCCQAYGLRSVALRYFNAAGAHPSGEIGEAHAVETHLIPLCIRAAMGTGPELKIFGDDYPTPDGTCIRDYVHVCDLADAHISALEFMDQAPGMHVFNLGNGNGFSVKEVLAAVEKVGGKPVPHRMAQRRAGDAAILVADSSHARRELGWRPRYSDIETIVRHAWTWHMQQKFGGE